MTNETKGVLIEVRDYLANEAGFNGSVLAGELHDELDAFIEGVKSCDEPFNGGLIVDRERKALLVSKAVEE